MEQNRLKELILSMRKSKHNMFKKVADFAQAVEDKGVIDMDTHELSNLVKDTLTKRRAKTFYADVFSSVIGEPDGVGEAPVFMAISIILDTENYALTQWKLGDPITVPEDINDSNGLIDPYMIFLTDEEAQKFNVSCEINAPDSVAEELEEVFKLFDIPSGLSQFKGNCTKAFGVFYLFQLSQIAAEYQSEIPDAYIKVTITYDGVDYVYQS